MPQDATNQDETAERVARIRADLDWARKAGNPGPGVQPATVYAGKYAEDVEFLLSLLSERLAPVNEAQPPTETTELEAALAHDEAGRVERRPKRGT